MKITHVRIPTLTLFERNLHDWLSAITLIYVCVMSNEDDIMFLQTRKAWIQNGKSLVTFSLG